MATSNYGRDLQTYYKTAKRFSIRGQRHDNVSRNVMAVDAKSAVIAVVDGILIEEFRNIDTRQITERGRFGGQTIFTVVASQRGRVVWDDTITITEL